MKKKQTVREELEEYLGTKITDEQYQKCILAFRSSHQGPAALGGYAVMGYYAPFQSISKELGKSIAYFFNGVGMSNLTSDGQKRSDRRQELIDRLREEDENSHARQYLQLSKPVNLPVYLCINDK